MPEPLIYLDDNPGRRAVTLRLSSEEAERKVKDLARAEQDKLPNGASAVGNEVGVAPAPELDRRAQAWD